MFWAEEFEKLDYALVVAGIEEVLVFADVEPCIGNLVQDFVNEVCGDFFVEKVSLF